MKRKTILTIILSILFWIVLIYESYGQLKIFLPKGERDSNYVTSYFGNYTLRAFTQKKYASFSVGNALTTQQSNVKYLSNTPYSIGVGAVYKIYNFNVSYGLPFNKLYEEKLGKSRALDFQTSFYGSKWVFDVFLQFYKGYYTQLPSQFTNIRNFIKPNLRNNTIGVTAHYLFNNDGFSYRAFRVNDEWQHKSSGTFMLSATIFANDLYDMDEKGFVPIEFTSGNPNNSAYRKMSLQVGPGLGYAYNLVLNKNWFLLMSANGRLVFDFGNELLLDQTKHHPQGFKTTYTLLGAIGYQNANWGLNFSALNNNNEYHSQAHLDDYNANMGYFKLNFLYRIKPTKFTNGLSKPLDYLLRK